MAEAILRKQGGEKFEVYSAGLDSSIINPFTLKMMKEAGYDMTAHTAKGVKEY